MAAVERKDVELITILLRKADAHVNVACSCHGGKTPLILAIENQISEVFLSDDVMGKIRIDHQDVRSIPS